MRKKKERERDRERMYRYRTPARNPQDRMIGCKQSTQETVNKKRVSKMEMNEKGRDEREKRKMTDGKNVPS